MKRLYVLAMVTFVTLIGLGAWTAFAQQGIRLHGTVPATGLPSTEKLPPDVRPDTLSRMPPATMDEIKSEEEKKIFQSFLDRGYNAKRLHGATVLRSRFPIVARAYNEVINAYLREDAGLDEKYGELAILTSCREMNERYEYSTHRVRAERLGISKAAIDVLVHNKDVTGLDEKEATIIKFGREMFRGEKVASKTFADAERHFGRNGTLAISLLVGYYANNALLFRAYDQHRPPERLELPTFPD